ncbi:MAG: hypothetical protein HYY18_10810 [Planctomycetes bacterium]|nr:hypothetical protein [Planctomycetota bacterium]
MSELPKELRELADILTEAVLSLRRIAMIVEKEGAGALAAPAPAVVPAETPKAAAAPEPARETPEPTAEEPAVERPWELILGLARKVLGAGGDRVWRTSELMGALRDAGLDLPTFKGLHFGLIPRLQKAGDIELFEGGTLRATRAAAPPPPPAPEPPPPPEEKPAGPVDEVRVLAQEIDDAEPFLDRLTREQRSAQIKVWGGRAREIQDRFRASALPQWHERWGDLRAVFGRLTRITREQPCGWVEPLTESWKTDWKTYVAIHQAALNGKVPAVTAEAERAYVRDLLLGLQLPGRRVAAAEAMDTIREGLRHFPDEKEPALQKAIQVHGRPPEFAAPGHAAPPPDEISELGREIDDAEPFLDMLPKGERTAQVRVWAGRARKLQDRLPADAPPARRAEMRAVFGRLTRITRELPCEWIEGLALDWKTDWDVYVALNRGWLSGKYPELTEEQERAYLRDLLAALFLPQRHPTAAEAADVIRDAIEVFPKGDEPDLKKALAQFGRPAGSPFPSLRALNKAAPRTGKEVPTERRVAAPPEVLEATRGKRVLMIGGQGAREDHRKGMIEAMQLAELEWVTSERNQSSPWHRLEERTGTGRYDFVIYLASFTSHSSTDLIRDFKNAGVPVVYLIRGYSVNQVVKAVEEQLLPRLREATKP